MGCSDFLCRYLLHDPLAAAASPALGPFAGASAFDIPEVMARGALMPS